MSARLQKLASALAFLAALAAPCRAQAPAEKPAGESVEIAEDGKPLAEPGLPASAATIDLMKKLEERHAGLQNVRGTLDQVKTSEVFLEEIRSTGKFWFKKPDFFRTDYQAPDPMINLIAEEAIYAYVPSLDQVEVYRFASKEERDQQLHSMALGFGFKAEEILREYECHSSEDSEALKAELAAEKLDPAAKVLIEIIPTPALLETSPFTRLKLWLDRESLLPEKVWFEDYNGDKTAITISQLEMNVQIEGEIFDPKKAFPAKAEWIDKTGP